MMSVYELQTVAFQDDSGIFCPECWTCESPEEERDARISAYYATELAGDDGLTCSTCGVEIVAPTLTCPECEAYEYDGHKPTCPTLAQPTCDNEGRCRFHMTGGNPADPCGDDVALPDPRQIGLVGVPQARRPEPVYEETVTPEETMVAAGVDAGRWAEYNRRMNDLIYGRASR